LAKTMVHESSDATSKIAKTAIGIGPDLATRSQVLACCRNASGAEYINIDLQYEPVYFMIAITSDVTRVKKDDLSLTGRSPRSSEENENDRRNRLSHHGESCVCTCGAVGFDCQLACERIFLHLPAAAASRASGGSAQTGRPPGVT
jgi:hypothetical protein